MNRLGTLHILTGRDITDTSGIGFRGFNINIIWFTHLINRNWFTVLFHMSNVTLITCIIFLYGNTSFLFMDTTSYRIASIYDDSICLFFTSLFIKKNFVTVSDINFLPLDYPWYFAIPFFFSASWSQTFWFMSFRPIIGWSVKGSPYFPFK